MQLNYSIYKTNDTSHQKIIDALLIYVQLPVCIIGSMLNFINFLVFTRIGISHTTYLLMRVMAFADATTLLLRNVQTYVRCEMMPICQAPNIKSWLYLFVLYVEVPVTNITENMSCWITLVLAIKHYISMKDFIKSQLYITYKNTKTLILIFVILTTIINMPYFFLTETVVKFEFNEKNQSIPVVYAKKRKIMDSVFYPIYSWIRFWIVQLFPLLLLCVFNSLLFSIVYRRNKTYMERNDVYFKTLRRWSKQFNYNKGNTTVMSSGESSSISPKIKERLSLLTRKQKSQYKLTVLLIVIILLFLIGQVPHAFAYIGIYRYLSRCKTLTFLKDCPEHELYRSITMILTLTCYSSNFFVYFFLNSHFKMYLLNLLSIGKCNNIDMKYSRGIKKEM